MMTIKELDDIQKKDKRTWFGIVMLTGGIGFYMDCGFKEVEITNDKKRYQMKEHGVVIGKTDNLDTAYNFLVKGSE